MKPFLDEALGTRAMGKTEAGFDYDRYRRLLAEAVDGPKRQALINLLIEEKAKQKLSEQAVREQVAGLGLNAKLKPDLQR
jgi:hypothetical protein